MANLKQIQNDIEQKHKLIEELKADIAELAKDRHILEHQQHKFRVGDKVELTKNLDTPERHKDSPGWSHALHFMHPGNIATIVDIQCYKQKVTYVVQFEDQKCYYTHSDGSYIDDHVWCFKEDELRYPEQKTYIVTIEYDLDGSCVRKATCSQKDLEQCLEELKRVDLIKSYTICEVTEEDNN